MKNAEDLKKILLKYTLGDCSEEEARLLEAWYSQLDISGQRLTDAQYEELGRLQPALGAPKPVRMYRFRMAAAAILCICLSLLTWHLYQQNKVLVPTQTTLIQVAPGSDKAILKLSNGQEYILKEGDSQHIKISEQVTLHQDGKGNTSYEFKEIPSLNKHMPILNTLSAPRGGQFRVTLPDGTRVWINAASSIQFPASFSNNERMVAVTGEVYFEVNKRDIPFRVRTQNQEIEVLGTHFNVSAYPENETIATTLLEGAVKISTKHGVYLLKPGQQCLVSPAGTNIRVVDVEVEAAWKDGDFVFNAVPIKQMMDDIARWYNIDIDYAAYSDRGDTFTGIVSRKKNLSSILQLLEKTNSLRFTLKGKTLYLIN
ncbi:FecR domain-containing protein [Sphingobacterium faecium]|uniref:FecR family protein n=1 Tax=Sphingobacterium faecium TaxID=34087 RepID=UPI0021B56128|nr:FecR domain-containing protein [Sphingobacterium faecium]UXD69398.1 FecR domain-containing protein [Sphingobacterium faecium]